MSRLVLFVSLLLAVLSPSAAAQDQYPSKPITLLTGFPPGGSADLTTRAIAPALQKALGQPVVIQTKPGAAAAIGTQAVAVAAPDGYTLTIGSAQISVLPAVDRVFGRKPLFVKEDFLPIARISADSSIIWSNTEQPWKTFQEMVADAKARPGQIVYASGGLYGVTHLPMEMVLKPYGLKMRHLPTAGGGPALTAVLGNNAALLVAHPGVGGPHAKGGKLRPLASMGARRNPQWPDVPTLKELGQDIEYHQWFGLFGQAKLPANVVSVLRDAMKKAVQDPDFIAAMAKAGSDIAYQDQEEFTAWWKKDCDEMEEAVKVIGKVE